MRTLLKTCLTILLFAFVLLALYFANEKRETALKYGQPINQYLEKAKNAEEGYVDFGELPPDSQMLLYNMMSQTTDRDRALASYGFISGFLAIASLAFLWWRKNQALILSVLGMLLLHAWTAFSVEGGALGEKIVVIGVPVILLLVTFCFVFFDKKHARPLINLSASPSKAA